MFFLMIFITILAFVQKNVRDNQRCNQKWTIKKDRKLCTRQSKDIQIKVITKLPNSQQSDKGKVKTHNYINRQNQSTTGKL